VKRLLAAFLVVAILVLAGLALPLKSHGHAVAEVCVEPMVATGWDHTVGLKVDGTVVAVGDNGVGQCNVGSWTNIVQVSAGDDYTVGLKVDGTVVAVGLNDWGQCNVGSWTGIVQVSAGHGHTVGLKADGTVVAVGANYDGRCNVGGWTNIVQVSAGSDHTVGLKADGTAVAVGQDYYGYCNVGGWTNIVQLSANIWITVGLKSDGTVVVLGYCYNGGCNVGGWTDIVQVSAGCNYNVGLEADGTVVAVGANYHGGRDVGGWTDIVQVAAGCDYTVGLKTDGTVVAVGDNGAGQCNVSGWYLPAYPAEVWVDDGFNASSCGGHTWGCNAFDKIQEGIDAVSGSTVHVAAGTYYENIVLKDGVELLGAGSANTIIDGMKNGSVVTAVGVGNITIIDGFTITNGSAALKGGGMYNEGSSPVIANCTFESNIAPYGAGICNYNASPAINNCTFNNNSATSGGGIYNRQDSAPAINNCTFYNNSATTFGGAIENYDYCSPAITGCTFQSNSADDDGGGIHNRQYSSPTINGCVFNSNSGDYGGGIYSYTSYAIMTNCIFNNNSAVNGGGIYNSGSVPSPIITNCNFWNNSASNGGGMYNYYSSPSISNCILWSNNPDGIYNDNCMPSASHSDVQGGIYAGTDNIDADPSFIDAPAGDFHLNNDSPCIDAGDNLAPSLPTTDFEGDLRIFPPWGTVDMGADEYLPAPSGFYGDANSDDHINATDISYVKAAILGRWGTPNPGTDANGDGLITATDISYVKAYILGRWNGSARYETTYDFSSGAGVDRWAKNNFMSSIPPALSDNFDTDPDGWVDADTSDYENISSTDGKVWTIAGSEGNYSALQCRFTLDEYPDYITSIGVTLNGSAETNGSTLQLWAWNFDTGAWRQVGGNFFMTTDIASYTAWTFWGKVYSDYIDGDGYMYILANLNNANQDMNVDYIKLSVVW
jgi:hypothetical protein